VGDNSKEIETLKEDLFKAYLGMEIAKVNVRFRSQEFVFSFTRELFITLEQVFLHNQYDCNNSNIKNKVVIDAGANVGVFSFYAIAFGASKVYAFEPAPETFELLKRNIEKNGCGGVIIPIKKGLGKKRTSAVLNEKFAGSGGSQILEPKEKDNKDSQTIEIISADELLYQEKEKIGFIKMDVEGYEENVLIGAKKIIARDKPVLSFSAYHKPTDIERLPQVVKSIRSDYRIILNEYAEKDFYCE
jgi:FkbM family methyltransferase